MEKRKIPKIYFLSEIAGYIHSMEAKDVGKALAEGVKKLMAAQVPSWNQGDLAERLGWSQGNVSRMMTIKRTPSAKTLAQLATVFGVTVPELFGADAPKHPAAKKQSRKKKPTDGRNDQQQN